MSLNDEGKELADSLGYQDGKGRCGAYVVGEEKDVVDIIMDSRSIPEKERKDFEEAYCAGYLRGASGELSLNKDRVEEKRKAREQDANDLASGKTTREELRKKNGLFNFPKVKINYTDVKKF